MSLLTEEQQMIRDMVREFAAQELLPQAARVDADGRLPRPTVAKLAALNLFGLGAPAESGGAGVDGVAYAIALEEVARTCASTAVVLLAHNSLGLGPILAAGSDAQRQRWVEPLASGRQLAAFALSEPEAGSDLHALGTTAAPHDDRWWLRGTKGFVVNARDADVFIVVTGGAEPSLFLVERDRRGVRLELDAEPMGWRGAGLGTLVLEDVEVDATARLGAGGDGFGIAARALDGARLALAAVAVGIAQGAFERSLRYARERPQFGKPIIEHQSVQWRLADAATEIHLARAAVHAACRLADSGASVTKEAAMAKLFAAEMASRVCDHAIQVHGGYGYITEYHVERAYRDAKLCEIAYGTSEVLRALVAAELGREADAGLVLLQ